MNTSAAPTSEQRVAKLFGLQGDTWTRHANPVSVATRFAVLPLLALSVWSRDRIGWWCLVPVVLSRRCSPSGWSGWRSSTPSPGSSSC